METKKPISGDIRADGYIFKRGKWRSPESLAKEAEKQKDPDQASRNKERWKRNHEKHKAKKAKSKRVQYQARKAEENKRRAKRALDNPELTRARHRRYYERHQAGFLARKRYRYWQNVPAAGLRDAISKYRSGDIAFDELDRRILEALKRADAYARKARGSQLKPTQYGQAGARDL